MAFRTNRRRIVMGEELLATYYYKKKKYNVYGCWDKETPENGFEFYDVYEDDGKVQQCVNLGNPYYDLPSRKEIIDLIEFIVA